MYQFFVDESQIEGKTVTVTGADYHHMRNVLRLKAGEEVAAVSGDLEYRCEVSEYDDKTEEAKLTVRFIKEDNVELPCRIYLFQGMPKGDKLEVVIQKAVELGAYEIIPVDMKRSVKKLDEKKRDKVIQRYNAISEAAAKQAKRRIIPKVSGVLSFVEALRFCDEEGIGVRLVPYELCDTSTMKKTRELLSGIQNGASIAVLIGPEGGFGEEEIEQARAAGFSEITLGRRILRTETAGMTVLSWLIYLLEQ